FAARGLLGRGSPAVGHGVAGAVPVTASLLRSRSAGVRQHQVVAKLSDGVATASNGVATASNGVATPSSRVAKPSSGVARLANGVATPSDGVGGLPKIPPSGQLKIPPRWSNDEGGVCAGTGRIREARHGAKGHRGGGTDRPWDSGSDTRDAI